MKYVSQFYDLLDMKGIIYIVRSRRSCETRKRLRHNCGR